VGFLEHYRENMLDKIDPQRAEVLREQQIRSLEVGCFNRNNNVIAGQNYRKLFMNGKGGRLHIETVVKILNRARPDCSLQYPDLVTYALATVLEEDTTDLIGELIDFGFDMNILREAIEIAPPLPLTYLISKHVEDPKTEAVLIKLL